ncbi:DNA polymerase III subunit alpha, partial [Rickettsiaceae bacterium]|nr:DNA polymerase III subunit alpha [Rickettsiaceae bacterium]
SSDILLSAEELSLPEIAYSEFEVMGLFLKHHPLAKLANIFEKSNIKNSNYIKDELKDGSHQITLCGTIIKKDARMSGRGRFVTLMLSDPHGIFEVTIYNENVLKDYAHLINVKESVTVLCDVYKDKGGLRITAKHFVSTSEKLETIKYSLKLYPKSKEDMNSIVNILGNKTNKSKSNSSIVIFLPLENEFAAKITMPDCFHLNESDIDEFGHMGMQHSSEFKS